MSESRHTSGPWIAYIGDRGSFTIERRDSHVICKRAAWYSSMVDESEANARLIAAAPEMLEALKVVVDFYSYAEFGPIAQARAAIAAAEGTIRETTTRE